MSLRDFFSERKQDVETAQVSFIMGQEAASAGLDEIEARTVTEIMDDAGIEYTPTRDAISTIACALGYMFRQH